MSSYGDVRVPPYLHSVITVLSFLASVILFLAFYHLVLAWKIVNNLKRSKNATRFEDGEDENVSLVPDIIDDVIDNILVNSQSSVANTGKIQEEEEGQATEEDAGVL